MKFCKDCAHCRPYVLPNGDKDYSAARCDWAYTHTDLVTGEKVYRFCAIEREKPWNNDERCGPEGLNFEPIPSLTH